MFAWHFVRMDKDTDYWKVVWAVNVECGTITRLEIINLLRYLYEFHGDDLPRALMSITVRMHRGVWAKLRIMTRCVISRITPQHSSPQPLDRCYRLPSFVHPSSGAESGWTQSWRTVVDWEPKPPGWPAASSGAESCCTQSWRTAAGREQPHKHWCLRMQQGCSDQQIA